METIMGALLRASLIVDANKSIVVHQGHSQLVTWTAQAQISRYFGEPATLRQYVDILRRRDYTMLLTDGSALQLSYTYAHGVLQKHRLCYYPNPLSRATLEYPDFAIEDLVEALSAEELGTYIVLESPIRFEYDLSAASDEHPAAHVHLTRDCCRLPMSRPLSVGHFIHFIMRNFYPDDFAAHEFLQSLPVPLIGPDELHRSHHFVLRVGVATEDP